MIEANPKTLTAADIETHSNLTRSQFLIWTGQQMAPDLPMYNMGWRFTLDLDVDPVQFSRAFDALVEATDTLRLTFALDGDVPMFQVHSKPSGKHRTVEVNPEQADALVQDLLQTPFDLGVETLRSALLSINGKRWQWIFVQHHIATDAATGSLLLDRLSGLYSGLTDQETATAHAPSFAEWAKGAGKQTSAQDTDFWNSKLEALPAPSIPYVVADAQQLSRTKLLAVPLGSERSAKLQRLIETDRFAALTTHQARFNFLATAVSAWLNRVSGSDHVVIGVTTHGRFSTQTKATAGLFMETLPLDAVLEPDTTFEALHAQIAGNAFELMMHASTGASSAASHAKFNVVLNYLQTEFGTFAGAPVDVDWLAHGHFDPAHALWIDVLGFDGGHDLVLQLRLNEGLFPGNLHERAAKQLLRVLDAMIEDPGAGVQRVALAHESDRSEQVTRADPWTGVPAPVDVCDVFSQHLRDDPSQLAVVDDTKSVSRADLDVCSGAIAQLLLERGVKPGDRVGLYLTRGANLVAAILGVLKSGAAFVPLDPLQPPLRLTAIADAAELALVLTEKQIAARWPDTHPATLVEDAPQMAKAPATQPVDLEADAYVIFTSGSTGTPKGVRVSRRSLARYADFAARTYGQSAQATWALHSAIGFDLTVTSIFAPLMSGGVIRAYRETLDSADLSILKVFSDDAVDIVKLTPAHLSLVTRQQQTRTARIRTLILGGENLTVDLSRAAQETLGADLVIYNEYGPTEATVGCMVHRFDADLDTGASVPIGRAAEATAIYVLDRGLNPVPDHVLGEIYITGPDRLAKGYLNLEAETREKFVSNPYIPGQLMYRSGDFAHVDAEGVIHYHGRQDDQIKIGSVRVELGEIHDAVLSHPAVTSCVVAVTGNRDNEPPKCGKCGLGNDHPDAEIDENGLCRLCREFEDYREKAGNYFRTMDDLRAITHAAAARKKGKYDCLMLLSGGKDSTYALGQLVQMTSNVLAVTLDNGFLSEQATTNIERVCGALGVEHRFMTTPHMNRIFTDSLDRHANVCNGCFKTVYTLGMQLAEKEGIGLIVTGLSRGQLFETRLSPELFGPDGLSPDQIDRNIMEARKSYHRVPDAAAQLLNNGFFDDEAVFERVQFVDFYRYCDVSVEEIYAYLDEKVPWLRPSDTGRSSNCLINDLGIYIHKKRRGYHNYALPYSWDVRTGHKTRAAALDELEDEIDEARMKKIMREIGYDPHQRAEGAQQALSCYVVADGELDPHEVRQHVANKLPRPLIPAIHIVPEIPLTPNGKADHSSLEAMSRQKRRANPARAQAPENETEALLLEIWRAVLDREDFGTRDNFFEFGGDSVHAISIASRATRAGLPLSALSILTRQTIGAVAASLTTAEKTSRKTNAGRATLDRKSKERLGALFGKRRDG